MLLLAVPVMHEWVRVPDHFLPGMPVAYPLVLGILLAVYGQLLRHSYSLVLATALLGYWVFNFGWTGYRAVRTRFQGIDQIVCGLGFFAVAVLVSLGKSGVLTRWIEARWGRQRWLHPTPVTPEAPPAVPVPALAHLVTPQPNELTSNPETKEATPPPEGIVPN